jgi:hypothetical protein
MMTTLNLDGKSINYWMNLTFEAPLRYPPLLRHPQLLWYSQFLCLKELRPIPSFLQLRPWFTLFTEAHTKLTAKLTVGRSKRSENPHTNNDSFLQASAKKWTLRWNNYSVTECAFLGFHNWFSLHVFSHQKFRMHHQVVVSRNDDFWVVCTDLRQTGST